MSSWSIRRQFLFSLIPVAMLVAFSFFVYIKYFKTYPTCFDSVKNGTETGIDCGGTCSLVCQGDAIAPVVLWSKSFNVSGGVWNSVAYIQNPNTGLSAKSVSYEFRLYDKTNTLIVRRQGSIDIPSNKTFVVFEGGVNASGKGVYRTDFEFLKQAEWIKDNIRDLPVDIENSPIENATTLPKIKGFVTNPNLSQVGPLELTALIMDSKNNVVDASKTVVDVISPGEKVPFVFTWPNTFYSPSDVCKESSNVMFVLDRSLNMQSLSKNPAQPLTDVKNSLVGFVSKLHQGDKVGVLSFGTTATNPIEQGLTSNFDLFKNSIGSINVSTSTKDQGVNIANGLSEASKVFDLVSNGNQKIVILLTGGIPTDPIDKIKGVNYPTVYAESLASEMRAKNIDIYTIGLGNNVDVDILKNISGDDKKSFRLDNAKDLANVYDGIGGSICERSPNIVEILSRVVTN
jgi:von Willebrand factor type A domain